MVKDKQGKEGKGRPKKSGEREKERKRGVTKKHTQTAGVVGSVGSLVARKCTQSLKGRAVDLQLEEQISCAGKEDATATARTVCEPQQGNEAR